jgi:hypothetical protein
VNKSISFTSNSFDSARTALENLDLYYDSIVCNKDCVELKIDVDSSESNGAPELVINFNQQIVFCQLIPEGRHVFTLNLDLAKCNTLSIGMTNKLPGDTQVIDGIIVADKWIKINQLLIDNYDLATDYNFFRQYFKYVSDKQQEPMLGFWSNCKLILEFESPFVSWYNERTDKNVSIANELSFREASRSSISEIETHLLELASRLNY